MYRIPVPVDFIGCISPSMPATALVPQYHSSKLIVKQTYSSAVFIFAAHAPRLHSESFVGAGLGRYLRQWHTRIRDF